MRKGGNGKLSGGRLEARGGESLKDILLTAVHTVCMVGVGGNNPFLDVSQFSVERLCLDGGKEK